MDPGSNRGSDPGRWTGRRAASRAGHAITRLTRSDASRIVATSLAVAIVVLATEISAGASAITRGQLMQTGGLAAATTVFSMAMFGIVSVVHPVGAHAEDWDALTAIGGIINSPAGLEPAIGRALDVILLIAHGNAAEIELAPRDGGTALVVSRGETRRVADGRRPAALDVPLECADTIVGAVRIWAGTRSAGGLDSSPRFLDALAAHLAVAIHSRQLREEARRRQEDASLLHASGLRLAAMHDRQAVIDAVVEEAQLIFEAGAAAICLGEASGLVASRQTRARPGCPGLSRGVPSAVRAAPCAACTLPCLGGSPADREQTISTPMNCAGLVIGDLCVTAPTGGPTARNQELLRGLAEIAAAAVNNCRARELEHRELVLAERARISREMHDSLAQALGYLHLKAEHTLRLMARDATSAERELENMAAVARDAYQDVREAILGLRETLQGPAGLDLALQAYAEKFARHSGIGVSVEVAGEGIPVLSPEAEIQVVRVVQEALTNVRKHARASKVVIRLDKQPAGMEITVQDDGCGFDWDALRRSEAQFGMKTMRERLEQIGGSLSVSSAVGRGTDVRLLLREER